VISAGAEVSNSRPCLDRRPRGSSPHPLGRCDSPQRPCRVVDSSPSAWLMVWHWLGAASHAGVAFASGVSLWLVPGVRGRTASQTPGPGDRRVCHGPGGDADSSRRSRATRVVAIRDSPDANGAGGRYVSPHVDRHTVWRARQHRPRICGPMSCHSVALQTCRWRVPDTRATVGSCQPRRPGIAWRRRHDESRGTVDGLGVAGGDWPGHGVELNTMGLLTPHRRRSRLGMCSENPRELSWKARNR
jgi:hypothetical protein